MMDQKLDFQTSLKSSIWIQSPRRGKKSPAVETQDAECEGVVNIGADRTMLHREWCMPSKLGPTALRV
jgi:hypothetical protein